MNDIIVDSSILGKCITPKTVPFKEFYAWLFREGTLCVSNFLLSEYSNLRSQKFAGLLNKLITDGRMDKKSNDELSCFRDKGYKYRCNFRDKNHVKLVMLSNRRLALADDKKFIYDVNNFPGKNALASPEPESLPYR